MSVNECYENLANAIVVSAARDYKKVYKRSLNRNRCKQTEQELAELETFFRSSWFSILTKADGEMIMERLRKECLK